MMFIALGFFTGLFISIMCLFVMMHHGYMIAMSDQTRRHVDRDINVFIGGVMIGMIIAKCIMSCLQHAP